MQDIPITPETLIAIIFGLFSLAVNIYQAHREDKLKGKIKSWLEFSRGIHAVSQQKGVEEISLVTNSLVVDLKEELQSGKFWNSVSFCVFLLAVGILIGMLIFK